jgi:hypothetical protein
MTLPSDTPELTRLPARRERLKVGLRTDCTPLLRVEQREVPLG